MKIKILTFGKIAEFLPAQDWETGESGTVGMLRLQLETTFPELKNLHFLIAVDKKIANPESPLGENAVVALLPPFSGG